MSSSFVFRNCLGSPLACSPAQVERCPCARWRLALKAREGKVGKELAVRDGGALGPGRELGRSVAVHKAFFLLDLENEAGGCSLHQCTYNMFQLPNFL